MNTTFKHRTSTLTWTGIQLTLVFLVLLVSSCTQWAHSPLQRNRRSPHQPRLNRFHQRAHSFPIFAGAS